MNRGHYHTSFPFDALLLSRGLLLPVVVVGIPSTHTQAWPILASRAICSVWVSDHQTEDPNNAPVLREAARRKTWFGFSLSVSRSLEGSFASFLIVRKTVSVMGGSNF